MKKTLLKALVSTPKLSLFLCVGLCLIFSFFAPKLQIDASTQTLLLENDKDLAIFREVSKRYEAPNFLVIAYTPEGELLGPESLELLSKITKDLAEVRGVKSVFSILNAPLLLNKPLNISELLAHIPSLSDENIDKKKAKNEFLNSPFYSGKLVSKDFKTTAIIINLEPNSRYENYINQINELKSLGKNEELKKLSKEFKTYRDELRIFEHENLQQIRKIITKYNNLESRLFLGGMNMIADDMIAFVKSDLATYGIATLVLTMLCLFLFYMQLRYVFIAAFICALCVGAASGLFALLGFEITVISSNYIALQLIITLSVIIHLINSYRENLRNHWTLSPRQITYLALRDRLSPCFFAIFTTAIGFISLVFSDIKPVSSLGVMMSASILLSLVIVFVLFGSFGSLLSKKQPNGTFEKYFSLTKYCAKITLLPLGRRAIFITIFFAFALGAYGISKLEVENSFIGYFKESTDIYKGMEVIDKSLGGTVPLDVVIKFKQNEQRGAADDEFSDFDSEFSAEGSKAQYWFNDRRMNALKKIDNYLKNKEFIGSVSSLNDLLEVGKKLNENRELDALALALLYNGLSGEKRELLLTPYLNTELDELHFSLRTIDSDPGLKRAIFLANLESELNELIKEYNAEVQISGIMKLYANMLHSLFSSQISSLGFVIFALFITFVFVFRSLKYALLAIVVNIVPLTCVLGIMGLAGLPLDIMSITISSISLGIGVDNALHYIHRYKLEFARKKSVKLAIKASHASIGYAMYYTSFAVFMGFGVMISSNFWPTIYFGLLTDLVMFFMLASALLFLPALIYASSKSLNSRI